MTSVEREILLLISRVRCITENQVSKIFSPRKKYGRSPFKKTLKKMCNEYTLRKYPCNINYNGYRDNSYVYYLNGSRQYTGKDLTKNIIGSELVIRMNLEGYEIKRFYRNPKIDNESYDIYIEYINPYNELHQVLVDIDLDNKFNYKKYDRIEYKIQNTTIPFFEVPNVLIITPNDSRILSQIYSGVIFMDFSFNKLSKYL